MQKKIINQIIVSLSRMLKDNSITATGVASPLPMLAILLAKKTKTIGYINCIGAINPQLKKIPISSVSISILEKKESSVTLAELWDYALRGEIETMFFSATQIDRLGNLNMTCIEDYKKPKVKLPGPAGSVSLRNLCNSCIVSTLNHNKRVFVEKVDFITNSSDKPTIVITNLGILKLGKNPEIVSVHFNSSVDEIIENTGFKISVPDDVTITEEPTREDLDFLDDIDPEGARYLLMRK